MLKSELVRIVVEASPHLYERDAEKIVSAIFDEITNALIRGDRVELRGFGAFGVKHRKARDGRNPATGVKVSVTEKRLPFFRASKEMHVRLNLKRGVQTWLSSSKGSAKNAKLSQVSSG